MVKQYKKRPVVIEALQWTKDISQTDALMFANHLVRLDDVKEEFFVYDRLHDTWVEFYYDDYIIKGLKGEFYPCRPDVFEESYELLPASSMLMGKKPGMR